MSEAFTEYRVKATVLFEGGQDREYVTAPVTQADVAGSTPIRKAIDEVIEDLQRVITGYYKDKCSEKGAYVRIGHATIDLKRTMAIQLVPMGRVSDCHAWKYL